MPGLLVRCGTEPHHQGWLQSLCSCLGIWRCLHFSAHFHPWWCWVGAEQCLGRAVSTLQFFWCSLLARMILLQWRNSQPALVGLPRSEPQVRSHLQRGSLAQWPESLWCRTSGGGAWRNHHQCGSGFWLLPQFGRELQRASERRGDWTALALARNLASLHLTLEMGRRRHHFLWPCKTCHHGRNGWSVRIEVGIQASWVSPRVQLGSLCRMPWWDRWRAGGGLGAARHIFPGAAW